MTNNYKVYYHRNKINNKYYIGITSKKKVEYRWGKDGNSYKGQLFGKAIDKYGWDNFEHGIFYENISKKEAEEKERELIVKYNSKMPNGYNITNGGDTNYKSGNIICIETLEIFEDANDVVTKHKHLLKDKYTDIDIRDCCEFKCPYILLPWRQLKYHYQYLTQNLIVDTNIIEDICFKNIQKRKEKNKDLILYGHRYNKNKYTICKSCGDICLKTKNWKYILCEKCKRRGYFFDSDNHKNANKISEN